MAKPPPPSAEDTTPVRMGGRLLIDLSRSAYTTVATAIKEYVSNGWDAGASSVTIRVCNPGDSPKTFVEILDNGAGMTRADLDDKFFRVGRDRRREEGDVIKTIRGKRAVHGRKGLGKLAGLKLADRLTVVSWQPGSLDGGWIDLAEIQKFPNNEPKIHWFKPDKKPANAGKSGTMISLTGYNRPHAIDVEDLWWNLCLWFEFGSKAKVALESATGTPDAYKVAKAWNIARSEVFEHLKTKTRTDTIEWTEDGKTKQAEVQVRWGWLDDSKTNVRSMVSVFSGTRALSTQEDFDIKKGFTNMFGIYKLVAEVRTDWLDQMPELDPADLKREGINWELHPALEALRDWGQKWVVQTCRDKAGSKKGVAEIREKTERLVAKKGDFKNWPAAQKRRLVSLVTQYASQMAFSTDELDRLIDMFAFLLQHGALIRFLQTLKESGKHDVDGFLELAQDFTASEIVGLLQVTRSKLEMVRELQKLIKDPKTVEVPKAGKKDITTFLAQSPWIFDPELRIDHKDQTMKRIVLETEKFPTKEINRLPSEYFAIRPDFVGFSGPSQRPICIELKRPTHTMEEDEAQRVVRYRAALLDTYPKLEMVAVSGAFSDSAKKLLKSIDVHIMHYVDVFNRAKNQLEDFIKQLQKGLEGLGEDEPEPPKAAVGKRAKNRRPSALKFEGKQQFK